jgi:GNAT superfamily N-acetyltransferase
MVGMGLAWRYAGRDRMSVRLPSPLIKLVAPNILEVAVTYLDMSARPDRPSPPTPPLPYRIELVEKPSIAFYRYLYNTVGAPWLWHERRKVPDAALAAVLADPRVWIYTISAGGEPAGYAELDARDPPDILLAYFGIVPKFIGQKLGPTLLRAAVDAAWTRTPNRLTVHTCSLDHPKALGCYQQAGFKIYDKVIRRIRDPRPLPLNL